MLPSEAAIKQKELLAQYSPAIQQQISTLTRKMYVLGFTALFKRMVEGPVVRTFYFQPIGEPKFSSILNKEEEFLRKNLDVLKHLLKKLFLLKRRKQIIFN